MSEAYHASSWLVAQSPITSIVEESKQVYPDSMKCPGCANEMTVETFESIEVDRCPRCGGVVLDKGELDGLEQLGLSSRADGAGSSDAPAAARTTPAHCHVCDRSMIALRGASDIEYDWCDGCERLFFDRGELSALGEFSGG
jgi:Zn-finger nucleic acid-binding protein